jgi:hypothetical protein
MTPGNEDARLVGLDRHVEHLGEHMMLQVRQPARAISLLGLQAAATRRAAALRVAFGQRDETSSASWCSGHRPQPMAAKRRCSMLAQALVEQDGAGIERFAADRANVLFEGNVICRS